MKNIKYLFAILIAITAIGCVDDPIMEDGAPPVVGGELKLNEIMSNNVGGLVDWIELYNGGANDIDLGGYKLNDAEDPSGGWSIPSGTIIEAGGFIVFDEDEWDFGGVGSSGEWVSFSDASGDLLDKVEVPNMETNVGLTYAREIDGVGNWMISNATPGDSNGSAENVPPIIDADPLTELDDVYEVSASDADGIASVKLVQMINNGVQSIDMAFVDGKYKTSVPKGIVGDAIKYYVVATDNSGLVSYYPETAPEEAGLYYVTGGSPLFIDVVIEGIVPGYTEDLVFNVNVVDSYGIEEVKLYYIFPGQVADDKENIAVTEPNAEGIYQITIPSTVINGQQLRYYLRAESVQGEKTYYPSEDDGTFDHDDETTWPIVYVPVVDTTVNYTDGPLTTVVFPTNPVPGTDINVVLTYASTDVIGGARLYFDVGENPVYVKDNKVKGEKDDSFTQTGVTINLKGVEADNDLVISDAGNTTTFYIRLATEDADGNDLAEYYYGSDGSMYLDDTPGGGTTDESDAFKADPTLWNVFKVQ